MNIPSSSQVLTCDFTNGKRATLQRSPKATVEPYAPLIWWGATQFLYSGYKKQNTPTGITHMVNAAKVASTSKDSKCPCTRESLALGSHHSEGNQGPRCQQQLLRLSSFHNGRQSLGIGCFRGPASRVIVVLCFFLSSAGEDHQHVKHIFMHISIWHTGLSCLGLSCFPGQSLPETGNPISRPALRNHTLPLLRMEPSQHLVTVLNHNFETLFVYYI